MLIIFFWQSTISLDKFYSRQTTLQETLEDTGTILYPSISICPRNIWDKYPGLMEQIKADQNKSFDVLKEFALQHHWTRDKLFKFVSHDVKDEPFPCNTLAKGGPER